MSLAAPINTNSRLKVTVAIQSEYGWRRVRVGEVDLAVKGYGRIEDTAKVAAVLARFRDAPTVADAAKLLSTLDGHFALAAMGPDWALAAVDWVRSIPLAWAQGPDGWLIDDQAERLRRTLGLSEVDQEAALALGMAGYTIDVATIYRGVQQLGPGEFVLFAGGSAPQRHRYYCYRPWRADKPAYDPTRAQKELAELTLGLIDKTMKSIGNRVLAVPLSAGRDSRLIVSAAHHLGYRNIRTFAYGHPGNHEAKTSQAIAERLGLSWRFMPTRVSSMRRYFATDTHASYLTYADTLQSAPFVQDLPQIAALKDDGFIPPDAVLCNGNSGDYISGAHIVPEMRVPASGLSEPERLARIAGALFKKHFALWKVLQTPENRARIERQLRASLARASATLGDPTDDYGLYEYAEFQDRQCKYVITGQRIYEYLGHEWRLPLWDKAYLDFFENVPLEGKVCQGLYAGMLHEENWGGVWGEVPVNAKAIRPHWLRPLRFVAKLAHAPFGADAWHRFERQYFQYWMGGGGHSAIKPYGVAAADRRGARNGIAWLTEAYLNHHGFDYAGRPELGSTAGLRS
jgi:asparagine synthase (glutamine-hydrolysing)